MDHEIIKGKIKDILVEVLGHENFDMSDEMTAADVKGWDSLTHMSILSATEKTFNVRFKLREVNKLKNMGSLIALVSSKI